MATKPTRHQQHACDQLAEALCLIADAARQDNGGTLGPTDFQELVRLAARASAAFGTDEIMSRALARRCRELGMPPSTSDLLTLWEQGLSSLEMLLLPDDALRALVARLEDELGEV